MPGGCSIQNMQIYTKNNTVNISVNIRKKYVI